MSDCWVCLLGCMVGWCGIYWRLLGGGGWIAVLLTVGLFRRLDIDLEGQVFDGVALWFNAVMVVYVVESPT